MELFLLKNPYLLNYRDLYKIFVLPSRTGLGRTLLYDVPLQPSEILRETKIFHCGAGSQY